MVFSLSQVQYFQCIKKWRRRKSFFQLIHQVICILSNFHPRFHICSLSSDFMAFPIDNELKAVNKISEDGSHTVSDFIITGSFETIAVAVLSLDLGIKLE